MCLLIKNVLHQQTVTAGAAPKGGSYHEDKPAYAGSHKNAGVIVEMTKQLCTELEFAKAVRKKGKRVGDIFEILRNEAGKHKSGNCGVSCGTDRQLFGIITAYYLEGKKAAEKKVAELY